MSRKEVVQFECRGLSGEIAHPRVFLYQQEKEDFVVCPYCARHFTNLQEK